MATKSNATQHLKSFQPGQSGNPAGRPKGSRNRSTLVSRFLSTTQRLNNPLTGVYEELSVEELLTLRLIRAACQGNTRAYVALMDSAYGRAVKGVQPTSQPVPPDAEEDLSRLSAEQIRERIQSLQAQIMASQS